MDLEKPAGSVELGLMRGTPPALERAVTLANWQDPPFNRWGFLHVRELIPTASISRGDGPVTKLPRDEADLEGSTFRFEGRQVTVREMLDATYTDGVLVLRDGRIEFEWYAKGMEPSTPHLLMSVSKSLTATLAGVLVDRGQLDPQATVPVYIDELRGSSFEGCTVQHLLDMRAGTRFGEEDYDDLESDARIYEEVANWRPRAHGGLPRDLYTYIAALENDREHGSAFKYRSILTDLLGWVLARAGGAPFVELFSRDVWSPIGAEQDAYVTVDAAGFPLVDGGICVTLRDLARFGLMHMSDGRLDGRRIVPEGWIHRLLVPDAELIAAFREAPEAEDFPAGAMYHDKWWVIDPVRGVYSGYGINGQQLLIHRPSRTVVAKFSTWPRGWVRELSRLQDFGLLAICEAGSRGREGNPGSAS